MRHLLGLRSKMEREIYVLCKKGSFYFKIARFLKENFFKNIKIIEHSGETVRGNRSKVFDYYDKTFDTWITIDGNQDKSKLETK
jgi:uncharacterized Fe-S cluster protein YjdI